MHRRREELPPCGECTPPLWPENREAAFIYLQCRGQLIYAGMGEPVEINHLAVHAAMRLHRVRDRKDCFEKVLALSREILAESREG